jgi:hypothetical protein
MARVETPVAKAGDAGGRTYASVVRAPRDESPARWDVAGVLGAVTVAVWVAWARLDGGFLPNRWGLLGLLLVLLVALALAVSPARPQWHGRARGTMFACLAGFVGWNYLSITWADFPGIAWSGADKTLLYAVSFVILAAWPRSALGDRAVLALFTLGTAAVGAAVLGHVALVGDSEAAFADSRLIAPTNYVNATAALWTLALWPALYLGSSSALPRLLRPIFLASASFLLSLAVLSQSRGWLLFLPLVAALALLLARERLRLVLGFALVAAGTGSILGPLLAVYDNGVGGVPTESDVDRAALVIVLASLGVGVAGSLWMLADRRVAFTPRVARTVGILVAVACTVALATASAWSVAAGSPSDWLAERWSEVSGGGDPTGETATRFTDSFASHRFEEWRTAWGQFLAHPLAGIGTDNFQAAYNLERTDGQHDPLYPHSFPLRLLSQLGIVGTGLFLAVAGIAVALAFGRRRRLDPVRGGAIGAALTVFGYWLVHGSVDWFWEMPALAAPAMGMLGLAAAPDLVARSAVASSAGPSRLRRASLLSIGAVAVLGMCAAVALPWLSFAYRQAGARAWRTDPTGAYQRFELAADLDPLSADALVVEGSVAIRLRDFARAREAFERALDREPKNWYAHLELALIAGRLGDYAEARVQIDRARALNPLDPGVVKAAELIERRAPIDPDEVNAVYLD